MGEHAHPDLRHADLRDAYRDANLHGLLLLQEHEIEREQVHGFSPHILLRLIGVALHLPLRCRHVDGRQPRAPPAGGAGLLGILWGGARRLHPLHRHRRRETGKTRGYDGLADRGAKPLPPPPPVRARVGPIPAAGRARDVLECPPRPPHQGLAAAAVSHGRSGQPVLIMGGAFLGSPRVVPHPDRGRASSLSDQGPRLVLGRPPLVVAFRAVADVRTPRFRLQDQPVRKLGRHPALHDPPPLVGHVPAEYRVSPGHAHAGVQGCGGLEQPPREGRRQALGACQGVDETEGGAKEPHGPGGQAPCHRSPRFGGVALEGLQRARLGARARPRGPDAHQRPRDHRAALRRRGGVGAMTAVRHG
mmetsp:Transcript_15714/g.35154  ORF Transcript_15714/g.35154 Transcript_15714/m.35154 type:complete len:361 (+) Transcript_15714:1007-2089(+)